MSLYRMASSVRAFIWYLEQKNNTKLYDDEDDDADYDDINDETHKGANK